MDKTKLTLRALGAWFIIDRMKKQGENITLKLISEKTDSSVTSVRNAVNELEEKGYLERKFLREGGAIRGIDYTVKSSPKVKEA